MPGQVWWGKYKYEVDLDSWHEMFASMSFFPFCPPKDFHHVAYMPLTDSILLWILMLKDNKDDDRKKSRFQIPKTLKMSIFVGWIPGWKKVCCKIDQHSSHSTRGLSIVLYYLLIYLQGFLNMSANFLTLTTLRGWIYILTHWKWVGLCDWVDQQGHDRINVMGLSRP